MSAPRGVAVVTGAGSGIGRAVAKALFARGLDLALLGRTKATLEATAREVLDGATAGRALALRCDVSDPAGVAHACRRAVSELGVPRVVVHSAGVVVRAPVEATTDDAWRSVLGINLDGTFHVTRALLPAMRERGEGRFVAIASISSTLGTPKLSAYCAAKWGVVGFMKALAEELRGSALAAMSVLPGSVDTAMLDGSGFAPAMQPEDVANTVVYAALDAPLAMNGSAIEIFG
ncbi:MAG: SDR family NAD(P)-dependent oxidoreductase [Myxococcales bacterium]|nr:SDR family NAD(P)-dependent oxidoreductase [Myxococcales bacterium]MBL0194412.1 SDR family NAD(P)-dependent oxidoreductase [Myxococcales bacterium]HQY60826.1 SDR family NAD(P)-dependent oxidoreductase [Polyangiaceae bacterium]